eukprot:m.207167 g.207167  ORF g.207167 m.207167 type:complete len:645 (-) comp23607_c0_seq1:13-1947(-)
MMVQRVVTCVVFLMAAVVVAAKDRSPRTDEQSIIANVHAESSATSKGTTDSTRTRTWTDGITESASSLDPHAVAYLQTLAPAQPVNVALFGVGDDWTLGHDTWRNVTQLEAIKALRVGVTRFPGGACSNYWNLTASTVVSPCDTADCANTSQWCWVGKDVAAAPADAFTTKTFLIGPAAATIDPNVVIDLNLLHFDEQTGPSLVDAVLAANTGSKVPLTRWELGNEYYLPSDWAPPQEYGCSSVSRVDGYKARSLPIVARIRQVAAAGSRVAAMASCDELVSDDEIMHAGVNGNMNHTSPPPPPQPDHAWNSDLASSGLLDHVDAVTLHDYAVNGILKVGPAYQPSAMAAWGDARIRRIVQAAPTAFPNKPIWMTEFGITYPHFHDGSFFATHNHGGIKAMFVLGRVLAAVASNGLVEILQYYSLGGQGWGADAGMMRWRPDGSGMVEVDAVGQIFAHASSVATSHPNATMHAIVQPDGSPLIPWGTSSPPAGLAGLPCLQAIAFSHPSTVHYIVLNRCNSTLSVTLPGPSLMAAQPAAAAASTTHSTHGAGLVANWTVYECGVKARTNFSALPLSSASFPWPAPIVPKTGVAYTIPEVSQQNDMGPHPRSFKAMNPSRAAAATVSVSGLSVLIATVTPTSKSV